MGSDFIWHRTFPVTAGLAIAMRNGSSGSHMPNIAGLMVAKKLEACGGSVGGHDTFT